MARRTAELHGGVYFPTQRTVATGPPPWSPLDLTNLVGFWRADMGVTKTGANVTAWADQSPAGNNLTGANSPQWASNSFNSSYAGITFNGSNTAVYTNAFSASTTNTASIFTLIMQGADIGGNVRITSWGDTTNILAHYYISSNQINFVATTGSIVGSPYAITPSVPQMLGITFDGTNARQYLAGTLKDTQLSPFNNFSASDFAIGASALGLGSNWDGTVAYCIFSTDLISGTDFTNLINWTNTTWGTSF